MTDTLNQSLLNSAAHLRGLPIDVQLHSLAYSVQVHAETGGWFGLSAGEAETVRVILEEEQTPQQRKRTA